MSQEIKRYDCDRRVCARLSTALISSMLKSLEMPIFTFPAFPTRQGWPTAQIAALSSLLTNKEPTSLATQLASHRVITRARKDSAETVSSIFQSSFHRLLHATRLHLRKAKTFPTPVLCGVCGLAAVSSLQRCLDSSRRIVTCARRLPREEREGTHEKPFCRRLSRLVAPCLVPVWHLSEPSVTIRK